MIDLQAELKGSYEVKKGDTSFEVRILTSEQWTYFHGHFPNSAVLPAVAILDISHYFLETYILKEKQKLKKLESFRVKSPVLPNQNIILKIEKTPLGQFQVNWIQGSDQALCAEFLIEVGPI